MGSSEANKSRPAGRGARAISPSASESLVERDGHQHDRAQNQALDLGAVDAAGVRMPVPFEHDLGQRAGRAPCPGSSRLRPTRLQPPTTAAVMAVSSYAVPMRLSPCPLKPVKRTPPRAERVPAIA